MVDVLRDISKKFNKFEKRFENIENEIKAIKLPHNNSSVTPRRVQVPLVVRVSCM